MRRWYHWLRRGHFPDVVELGPARICLICDVGTPTGSVIRNPWVRRPLAEGLGS